MKEKYRALYNYILSTIIVLASIYFGFKMDMFGSESVRPIQIFTFALLGGWSVREVWNYE